MGLHYWSHEEAEHDDSYVPEHFRVEAGPSPSQLKEVVTKVRRRGAGFCSTLNTLTKTCLELVVFNQEFSMVSLSRKRPLGVMPLLASIPRGQSQGSGHGYAPSCRLRHLPLTSSMCTALFSQTQNPH